MLRKLKNLISDRHPIRLLYHKIMAFAAAVINGFPGQGMIIIGVTGTNGKTTTLNLLNNILTKAGHKVGMATTINFQIGEQRWVNDTKQTTVSPFYLQKLLRRMANEKCKYVLVEVTSHAITQSRIYGINFDIALITNISADHVEYHGSLNNYVATKGRLFKNVSKSKKKFGIPKILIMNNDDKFYSFFNQFVADRKMTFGLKSATISASSLQKKPQGTEFMLNVPNNSIPIKLPLPGEFNVYNSLAAASICLALQVPLEDIKSGLEQSATIAGRLEHVNAGQSYSVVVDYAHAPESLEKLLKLYRGLTEGKIFLVFGATGGGRDKSKRPKMGMIANEYADYIVLTNDDPYEEDEWQIIDQVSQGIPRKEGHDFWKIPDRKEAIRLALTKAHEGDCVLVAGKGAEEVMMIRGKRVVWNDKNAIKEILNREIKVEIGHDNWEKRENVCLT